MSRPRSSVLRPPSFRPSGPPSPVPRRLSSVFRPPPSWPSVLPALRLSVLLAFILGGSQIHAGLSFDTGMAPEEAALLLAAPDAPSAPDGSWLRLRDMDRSAVKDAGGADTPPWSGENPPHSVAERRQALQQLRAKGFHLVALVAWPTDSWTGGVRTDNPIRRLPYDLREPFARGRALAATYGDLIDYWEIGNEPDISFIEENPETYAAFLKACYLGIAAGRRTPDAGEQRTEDGGQTPVSGVRPSGAPALRPPASVSTRSRVLMAPLALPPGPYLEAFLANDGLRYTDGFNYHYYGYAEDFTGVYQQFRAAVSAVGAGAGSQRTEAGGRKPEDGSQKPDPSPPSSVLRPLLSDSSPSVLRTPPSDKDCIFVTAFYPGTTGWNATTAVTFDHIAEAARTNRSLLASRPLAVGEPALESQGRWLVTPGVTVEEIPEGWRFQVTALPQEPLRPAMAELPLPDGWKPGSEALLSFEYRIGRPEGEGRRAESRGQRTEAGRQGAVDRSQRTDDRRQRPEASPQPTAPDPPSSVLRPPSSLAEREFPVFLTEYGYGLLGKDARSTPEGRARQAAWFSSVQKQIHDLGIEGAMAFLLKPYLEADRNEFGLLIEPEGGGRRADGRGQRTENRGRRTEAGRQMPEAGSQRPDTSPPASALRPPASVLRPPPSAPLPGAPQPFQLSAFNFQPSVALAALVSDSHRPITPVTWSVPAAATPSSIVLDFVAGAGLAQAKSYGGYLMTGDYGRPAKPAEGRLVAYNVGTKPASGELHLDGDSWTLSDGSHALALTLDAGERREIPVQITPTLRHFAPQPAQATFHVADTSLALRPEPVRHRPGDGGALPVLRPSAAPLPVQTAAPLQAQFETYLRTTNGNLYQTWPRLTATENWRPYSERLGNFTMAFFGRARQPWRLAENVPAALAFFFRPDELPLTFEIRRPCVIEFSAP